MIHIAICCPPAFGHLLPSLQLASQLISLDRLRANGVKVSLFTQLGAADIAKLPATPDNVEVVLMRRNAAKAGMEHFEDFAEHDIYGEYTRLASAYYDKLGCAPKYVINCQLISWGKHLAAKYPGAKLWGFHASPINVVPLCMVELFPPVSQRGDIAPGDDPESRIAPVGAYSRPLHRCCCSYPYHTDPEVAYMCPLVGPVVYDDMPVMPPRNGSMYKMFCESFRMLRDECEVILCNDVLEFNPGGPIQSDIEWQRKILARTHAIGPLCKSDVRRALINCSSKDRTTTSLAEQATKRFLDAHEPGSVVFVGLGSWCDLDDVDLINLTEALAACKRPVIWAFRGRAAQNSDHYLNKVRSADAEVKGVEFDPATSLPVGWIERLGDQLLLLSWVNQIQVLSHPAVGCFVSHCGWNSLVESIVYGPLPVVALPVAAEQAINAKLISDVYHIALRARDHIQDTLQADRLLHCIREVMHHQRFRINAERLHQAALAAADKNTLDSLFNDL